MKRVLILVLNIVTPMAVILAGLSGNALYGGIISLTTHHNAGFLAIALSLITSILSITQLKKK